MFDFEHSNFSDNFPSSFNSPSRNFPTVATLSDFSYTFSFQKKLSNLNRNFPTSDHPKLNFSTSSSFQLPSQTTCIPFLDMAHIGTILRLPKIRLAAI